MVSKVTQRPSDSCPSQTSSDGASNFSCRKPHSGGHQTIQTSGSLLSPEDTTLEDSLLSVAVSSIGASVITPIEVLRAIWKKASELLHESKSVVIAPGHGEKSRMVRSYSGSRVYRFGGMWNGGME